LGPALFGMMLWVVCLNGGTLALNSAFDRDEGDVAYLRLPPAPPRHLAAFGLGLIAAGQLATLALPLPFTVAYAVCFVMSVLYSVPPFRLKAVAGADWVINMVGFGTLTPYAGWAATGLSVDSARGLVLLGFCPLFAALYPLTQLYQLEEDIRRGDRTLASRLGVARSLDASLCAAVLAFAFFVAGGWRMEWRVPQDAWRWGLLALAVLAWGAVLVPWRVRAASRSPAEHQRGMYRALVAWALTDVVVVLAWGR
ncbi:MAG: UbiA family prenyltransferase, partial [Gemmatimonadales bacterium]